MILLEPRAPPSPAVSLLSPEVRIPEGESATDEELLGMGGFVEVCRGDLPE